MSLLHGNHGNLSKAQVKNLFFFLVAISILLFCPDLIASTGGSNELSSAKDRLMELAQGDFPVIISIVSFLFGVMGCVFKFSAAAILTPFGVSIASALGPGIIETTVGALI